VPGKERLTNRTTVRFTLSPRGSLATQDVTAFAPYPATKESIEYIVAFLNLEAVTNWIRAFGLMKGGVAEFSEKPLSEIPLRRIDWSIPREAEMHNEITNLMQELRNGSGVEGSKLKLAGLFAELMLGQKG
jgi:adenine-specific DNA-methyltransferase